MVVPRIARSFLVCTLVALGALTLLPSTAGANQVGLAVVLEKFTIKNNLGVNATDYHLKIHSDDELLHLVDAKGGAFFTFGAIGEGTHDLTVNFESGTVADTKSNTFKVVLKQQGNRIRIDESYWTPRRQNVNVPLPGFDVVDDPVYTIFNDFDDPLGIRALQFLVNVPEMADDDLIPGLTPGFGVALPDFILPPGGFLTLNIPGTIDPGNYLYAQMSLFDATSGDTTGAVIQGHQATPVPEPTTLVLLGVGLATATVRRRKR